MEFAGLKWITQLKLFNFFQCSYHKNTHLFIFLDILQNFTLHIYVYMKVLILIHLLKDCPDQPEIVSLQNTL